MTRRGPAFPESGQRPPFQIEPDGKRYRIKGRQVTYMNWRFDFRMSTLHGPQLYDIRYQNKRIVYELSVQEIAVFYSGHSPIAKYANFFDSIGLIGSSAKGLVPGVDCPAHATFLPSSHFLQKSEKLVTFQNVFCVFEQDTGMPLRRHHSYSKYHGMSKQILPKDKGNEPSASWFRYQMAVTKHKETERSSSSLYSTLESVVNFQTFIDDNESLMDEDLVAWISLGIQHIPHTEDLPVTHTPGMDLSFFLLPYNYFPEDPSMASRDSVRIEPKMKNNANVGINFIRHSKPRYKRCLPKKNMYQELLQKNPGILFDLK
ncbi:hypothetical protein FSP39_012547 [Pinctada imbricata]|uniref:Amine oxidase n=1 Tax=Pinctada imbricata TaxID=66713 RepID=A0AA88Y4I9_PINIB|nr:hypothetical protein FSP39_012547 [Pinctada imbricata]